MATARTYTTYTMKDGNTLTDYEIALLIPWVCDSLAGRPLRELPEDEFAACMRIFARLAPRASASA